MRSIEDLVNGAGLASGSITGLGTSGGDRIIGLETSVLNELAELESLQKVIEGAIAMTSTLTPTLAKPSPPTGIQSPLSENSYPALSHPNSTPPMTTITSSPLHIIQASILYGSLGKVFTSSPLIH